jgi:hypothetical protein
MITECLLLVYKIVYSFSLLLAVGNLHRIVPTCSFGAKQVARDASCDLPADTPGAIPSPHSILYETRLPCQFADTYVLQKNHAEPV